MRKQRDTHPRARGSRSGRLDKSEQLRQGLKLVDDELARALASLDSLQIKMVREAAVPRATARDHVELARKLLAETASKVPR